ncbi:MAG TPA: hypothetical protein DCL54_07535 [Alphaproteobacteria bacterium]|nr:hypothetical protein [Alphaproteobacteria bacterium]
MALRASAWVAVSAARKSARMRFMVFWIRSGAAGSAKLRWPETPTRMVICGRASVGVMAGMGWP